MPRKSADIPESERYTEQMNVRFRPHVAVYVSRLVKITGETRQEFFDRLVLQEVAENQELFTEIFDAARAALDKEEADFFADMTAFELQTKK